MNCKQGDLAVHIGGYLGTKSPNLGKVLTCIRLATGNEKAINHIKRGSIVWVTDILIEWEFGGPIYLASDSSLRPLRGDLSKDDAIYLLAAQHQKWKRKS